jgi:hypothetical protein
MPNRYLQSLLEKEMTRRDFLGFTALTVASMFGVFGVITELLSHAATPYASEEAENGTKTGLATVISSSSDSQGEAIVFSEITSIPSTGSLANRIIFGAAGGDSSTELSTLGTQIGAYNTYAATMSATGAAFPTSDGTQCLANKTELHISWDVDQNNPPTMAAIADGSMDSSLAAFFAGCKTHGKRIILRMWWEMNLSGGQTKPGNITSAMFGSTTLATRATEWIAAWQHVYNYCRKTASCTNVFFFYCPNGSDGGSGCTTMEETWPGIDYVDITGIDTYCNPAWGTWESFPNMASWNGSDNMWSRLLTLAPDLPMAIGETGCVQTVNNSETQDGWLTSMFACTTLPNLHWVDYFNINSGTDWTIDTTASLNVIKEYASDTLPAWTAIAGA